MKLTKKEEQARLLGFEQGASCAIATLVKGYGASTEAQETFECFNIKWENVDEADREALEPLFKEKQRRFGLLKMPVKKYEADPDRCHAGTDGDCDWEKCPQKVKYETGCKLWLKHRDEDLANEA